MTPMPGSSAGPSSCTCPRNSCSTPSSIHFLLEKVGFHRINRWDEADTLGRKDRRWATHLFVLERPGSRSLDQIEAILNRDTKDATYKPALFRALFELATTSSHENRAPKSASNLRAPRTLNLDATDLVQGDSLGDTMKELRKTKSWPR
jgi:hypothetical protein